MNKENNSKENLNSVLRKNDVICSNNIETTEKFLQELKDILVKYNGAIVRSAGAKNKLVVSLALDNGFTDIEFEEDITEYNIRIKDYKQL